MWKLDLLEAKFKASSPRFPHTKKLILAKNNSKLLRKLPTNPKDAELQINALKKDFFDRKYYAAVKKLEKEVSKLTTKAKNEDVEVKSFISKPEHIDAMVASKIIKIIQQSILVTKELRSEPPSYINKDIIDIIGDKSDARNPSRFFIDNCQNNKKLNNYISNLWNNKQVKSTLGDIEWSFKMVRGDLTKQEKDNRKAQTGKNVEEDVDNDNGDESDSDDDENDDSASDGAQDSADEGDIPEIDEKLLDKYAIYESGDEGEVEHFSEDPNVNYNEITDEEPSSEESEEDLDVESEEDEFFEESEKETKPKHKLPEMATGYFSGGESDSDVDNDEVVKKVTTQRKNRRGQRARQKIWEQKYGKEAKHVKLEKQRYQNEREQKQREFEERQRRREEKARLAVENAPSGSNVLPLGERKARVPASSDFTSAHVPAPVEKVHPSWEAKRLAEEKQKNVKFTGKKITFD